MKGSAETSAIACVVSRDMQIMNIVIPDRKNAHQTSCISITRSNM